MIIRRYQPSDLDAVLQLFYDTVHTVNIKDYSEEQINAWAPPQPDKERWAEKFLHHCTFVAYQNSVLVGFADISADGLIDHVYVHKDYQGQGIGSALLAKLEQEAKTQGIKQLTTEASITAQPFFERHGFITIKKQEKLLRSMHFITLIMSKKI